jgi:glycosyltransferase involved in cell wall biosynthesis
MTYSCRPLSYAGAERLMLLLATAMRADLGDGPQRTRLAVAIGEHRLAHWVRRIGYTANPWCSYARADALLMSSRIEGTPRAALESHGCGTPVIATPESGRGVDLAVEASSAAVFCAEFGEPFPRAIDLTPADRHQSLRTSILPGSHEPGAAAKALVDRVQRCLP